jgi:hypothetical protein
MSMMGISACPEKKACPALDAGRPDAIEGGNRFSE